MKIGLLNDWASSGCQTGLATLMKLVFGKPKLTGKLVISTTRTRGFGQGMCESRKALQSSLGKLSQLLYSHNLPSQPLLPSPGVGGLSTSMLSGMFSSSEKLLSWLGSKSSSAAMLSMSLLTAPPFPRFCRRASSTSAGCQQATA